MTHYLQRRHRVLLWDVRPSRLIRRRPTGRLFAAAASLNVNIGHPASAVHTALAVTLTAFLLLPGGRSPAEKPEPGDEAASSNCQDYLAAGDCDVFE